MKKINVHTLIVFFLLASISSFSQYKFTVEIEREAYKILKDQGKLKKATNYKVVDTNPAASKYSYVPGNNQILSANCGSLPPLTYTNVTYGGVLEVDDDSEGPIALPFTFCFYGTNYTDVYINSNGNITFGAGQTSFSSTGFPNGTDQMIAPFWADFDNGGGNGVAKISMGTDYMVVTWDSVGYFNEQGDKRNTCTVVITDGLSPILPVGNNVGFYYENMDWTTGSASGGTNGFGGTAATVGVNKGDNINFVQIGRFDTSGTAFISNVATNNGVDWLDNKSFFFNLCAATNIAPISTNYSSCDTLRMCGFADTLLLENYFASPEVSQITNITVSAPSLGANFTTFSNTPGSSAHIISQIISSPGLVGYHTINYTATDNGTPAQTTVTSVTLFISNPGMVEPIVFANPTGICPGESTTLTLNNCASFINHIWLDGTTGCNTTIAAQGTQYVTVEDANGCVQTEFVDVQLIPEPLPIVQGNMYFCGGQAGTALQLAPATSAEPNYANVIWTPGNVVGNSFTAAAGSYTVTVTGVNGCSNDATFTVADLGPPDFTTNADACFTVSTTVNLDVNFDCVSTVSCALGTPCVGSTSQSYSLGTASAAPNSGFGWPTPYGNFYSNSRHQYLVLASELTAMGVQPGLISALSFSVTALNTVDPLPNYTIKMMCTNLTTLPPQDFATEDVFVPGTIQVYSNPMYTVGLGLNTHTFTQPYAWDGTSNLIIETCFDQTVGFSNNASVTQSNTPFISTINAYSDGTPVCTSPISTAGFVNYDNYTVRPDMMFEVISSVDPTAFTYSWNTGSSTGPQIAATKNTTVTPPGGSTTYYITVTSSSGGVSCSRTDSVTFLVASIPAEIFTLDSVFCKDEPVQQFVLSGPTGGVWSHFYITGTNPYTTSPGNGIIANGSNVDFHPELSVLGLSYVKYIVGSGNCILQDSVMVAVNQAVLPNFVINADYCSYDPAVTLSNVQNACATGINCGWTVDGIAATVFDPSLVTPTTHTLTYTTDVGGNCPRVASHTVAVHPAPVIDFSADTLSGCLPSVPVAFTSTVTTTPAAVNAYVWAFGDASSSGLANPVHVYSQTGDMSINLNFTDINGCVDSETKPLYITINSVPEPEFIFEPSTPTTLEPHVEFVNTTASPAGLLWSWDIAGLDSSYYTNISYDFPEAGTYQVTLTAVSEAGCKGTYTNSVTVMPDYVIYVPSAFTPNNDGKNDVFIPKYSELSKDDYSMTIYDKWGGKVFETNDITEGWKGSKNNTDNIIPGAEVFIYKIIYKDANLKGHVITGQLSMLK